MLQYSTENTQFISPNLKPVSGTGLSKHSRGIVLFTKDNEKGENLKKRRGKVQLERRSEE